MYYTSYGFICSVSFRLLRYMAFSRVAIHAGSHLESIVKVSDLRSYGIFFTYYYSKTDEKLLHKRSFVKVGPLTVI